MVYTKIEKGGDFTMSRETKIQTVAAFIEDSIC